MKTTQNKTYITIVIFLTSLIILSSCSKYEENDIISLKTANSRIRGEWKLVYMNTIDSIENTYFIINLYDGTTITSNRNNSINTYPLELTLKFTKDSAYINLNINDEQEQESSVWKWLNGTSKHEIIYFNDLNIQTQNLTSNFYNFLSQNSIYYKIIKLTNKELIIENSFFDNFSYIKKRWEFKKIK